MDLAPCTLLLKFSDNYLKQSYIPSSELIQPCLGTILIVYTMPNVLHQDVRLTHH